jgi:predicted anti-sigma-YlaC factor YlaD
MTSLRPSLVCERVRSQVSRELDGELSELERRMLTSHLERCAECREYQEDLLAFTRELREAPLEQLSHPIEVHRPRRASLAWAQMGVAAAVAVAVFGTLTHLGPISERGRASSVGTPTQFQGSRQAALEVRQIIADGRAFKRAGNDPARAV